MSRRSPDFESLLAAGDDASRAAWVDALAQGEVWAREVLDSGLAREVSWARSGLFEGLRALREWAWRYMQERYAPELAVRVRRVLGEATEVEACVSDILFDFVTHYCQRPAALDSFPGYLWAMAATYPLKRRRRARHIVALGGDTSADSDGPTPSALVAWSDIETRALVGRRLTARLSGGLGRLTDAERELLRLRLHDDLSFSEIGRLRGTSPQAVHKAYERLLARLRRECGLELEPKED